MLRVEQDAIDSFLLEMIGINLKKSNIGNGQEDDKQLIQDAENIINELDEKDRNTVRRYVDNLIYYIADEEMCLYKAGIKDGIRLLNWITAIDKEYA